MPLIDKLAFSLGRIDEIPNVALAAEIVKKGNTKAVGELITLLAHKNKNVQNDTIKVLYEIGGKKPEMIADYTNVFLSLLDHRNNRLVWGAMSALACISSVRQNIIYTHLAKILEVAAKGSVIARDQAVNILINLAKVRQYAKDAQTLLFAEIASCPVNQLPMYAERTLPVVTTELKRKFKEVLQMRLEEIEQESKRKRIEKVLKRS